MKLTMKTSVLQGMLAKAVKGARQNRLIPLSSMICINKVGNKLILTTTDNMNSYLYVIANNVEGEDFYVTVEVEQFYKLVSKMTSEDITLKLDNNVFEVIGNGRYSIEIPQDESGEIIKFPDPYREIHPEDTEDIEFTDKIAYSDIINVVNTVKTSLATTMEIPVITNYFVGDFTCATDTSNITAYDKKLVTSKELLISPELMNLMTLLTEEEIDVKITDDYILFVTKEVILYSTILPDIEDYPVDAVSRYIKQAFDYNCNINRQKLLALLDRISLFVSTYDENVVNLHFKDSALTVSTNNSGSDEVLKYEEKVADNIDFEYKIDIVTFIEHLKSCIDDVVTIGFGDEQSIKIIDGNVTKVLALSTEE